MEIKNDELNLKVAQALGWKMYTILGNGSYLDFTSDPNRIAWHEKNGHPIVDDIEAHMLANVLDPEPTIRDLLRSDLLKTVPDYAEDIAPAMGLATLMAKTNPVGIRLYHNMAWVSVSDHRYVLTTIASGSADKPARAICLAFLQWKQGKS